MPETACKCRGWPREKRIAYHEAGHAIAHLLLNGTFEQLSIRGNLRMFRSRFDAYVSREWPVGLENRPEKEIQSCLVKRLAGPAVSTFIGDHLLSPEHEAEEREVQESLEESGIRPTSAGVGRLFRRYLKDAALFIREPLVWAGIEALAETLVISKTVSYTDVFEHSVRAAERLNKQVSVARWKKMVRLHNDLRDRLGGGARDA